MEGIMTSSSMLLIATSRWFPVWRCIFKIVVMYRVSENVTLIFLALNLVLNSGGEMFIKLTRQPEGNSHT